MPACPLLPGWLDSVAGPVLAATGVASTDELTGDLLRQWARQRCGGFLPDPAA